MWISKLKPQFTGKHYKKRK